MAEKEAGKQPSYPRAPPPFSPPNCPRCYSSNTKFCYYNNYSVSQPRYLCKECRRYWTHGGVLRNIPCGGSTRKRGRADSTSSSSQISNPPPTTWVMKSSHEAGSVGASSSSANDTFKPEATHTMQSFIGSGFSYQPPFMFNPNYDLGGVNAAFGALNVAFGCGPTPQPASSTLMLPQLSPFNNFGEFGIPFVQQPLPHQPPPPPPPPQLPTAWAGQNMGLTTTNSNDVLATSRDATAVANVVSINEWSELNDMDNECDPLQIFKPPSP